MIRALVVDDNSDKVKRIYDVLQRALDGGVSVDHASNVFHASQSLGAITYDILIVDLNLPKRPDSQPVADGGITLLENLLLSVGMRRPTHIFGLTAYSELQSDKLEYFRDKGWHLILYSESNEAWSQVLGNLILHASEAKEATQSKDYRTDLAIVTALDKPELSEVLRIPAEWSTDPLDGDDTVYHVGCFRRGKAAISVVACSAQDMGMSYASALAMKLIHRYRPRFLAMAGIAAGTKGNYGDLLFADNSWDYGSGKSRWRPFLGLNRFAWVGKAFSSMTFDPAPVPIPLSRFMKARLGMFGLQEASILEQIQSRWDGKLKPSWPLRLHRGPVASGAAVLENIPLIQAIRRQDRKLIGIEMETYGIFVAAQLAPQPAPLCFSVKSVCDFGDHRKGDEWQKYAAFTSAQFVYEFALSQLTSLSHNARS